MGTNPSTTSLTKMLSVRVPNELWEAIEEYAKAHKILLTASRANKRGHPNMSEATIVLLRSALGITEEQPIVGTIDSKLKKQDPSEEIRVLKARLAAVEAQLQQQPSANLAPVDSDNSTSDLVSTSDLAFQVRVAGLFTDKPIT